MPSARALGIEKGSQVWYRVFKHPQLVDGLGSLMPKWLPGKVEECVSKTSFLIASDATGRLISRHISDLHPAEVSHKFSSQDNAEMGFKKLIGEATGATQELEKPEDQMDATLNNRDVIDEVDDKMRQNF